MKRAHHYRFSLALMAAVLLGLAAAWPSGAAPRRKQERAIIRNSGSTNTNGYYIAVFRNGRADYGLMDRRSASAKRRSGTGRISSTLAAKFFRDLTSAMPLSRLPVKHGLKSASFGSSTAVEFRGQRSPDLSFPGDARSSALHEDAAAIARALHLP